MTLSKASAFIVLSVGVTILFVYTLNLFGLPRKILPGLSLARTRPDINATLLSGSNGTTGNWVILVYTTFFGIKEWVPLQKDCPRENPCSIDKFEVTYDKQRLDESDFILFHARDMPSEDHLKMLLKTRRVSQWWVYFLMESPNATPNTEPLNGFFNLTWTYRTDSDIWVPYASYTSRTVNEKTITIQNFTEGKSKLVAWMVSNCGPTLRKEFVHKLQNYVQVDVFGGCSKEFGEFKSCSNGPACRTTISQYKFYLALENALCEDYVTEKYWGHLGEENIVPVVMGGANYSKLAIPGSYINVMDFKTVKELAEYLQYLDKNSTAYNEFFKWKLKYALSQGRSRVCEICLAFLVQTPPKSKVYNDLTEYWVKQGKCNQKDQMVRNMWQS